MFKKLLKIGLKLIINIIKKLGILKQHQKELFHGYLIHKLTYDDSNEQYKIDFNHIIQKQT